MDISLEMQLNIIRFHNKQMKLSYYFLLVSLAIGCLQLSISRRDLLYQIQQRSFQTIAQVEQVLQSEGTAVVVFTSSSCSQCHDLTQYLKKKALLKDVPLIMVDKEQAPELAKFYQIEAVPTIVVVKDAPNNSLLTKVVSSELIIDQIVNFASKTK